MNIARNLEPTITFYEECVGWDATRTMIVRYPKMVSYILENRLKPRVAEGQEAGIPIDTATLLRMGKNTDEKWSNSLSSQKRKLLK